MTGTGMPWGLYAGGTAAGVVLGWWEVSFRLPRYQAPSGLGLLFPPRFERRPQSQIVIPAMRRTAAAPIAMPAMAPVERPWDAEEATGVAVFVVSEVEVMVGVGVRVTVAGTVGLA